MTEAILFENQAADGESEILHLPKLPQRLAVTLEVTGDLGAGILTPWGTVDDTFLVYDHATRVKILNPDRKIQDMGNILIDENPVSFDAGKFAADQGGMPHMLRNMAINVAYFKLALTGYTGATPITAILKYD